MKNLLTKIKSKTVLTFGFLYFVLLPELNFVAASTGQVRSKLNSGLTQIQTVITGLVVIVGIIAAVKVILKFMPSLDDPHSKNEMWRSVGTVGIGVGAGAAVVWIVPWLYKIFS